jgi:hypothetical protein
MIIHRERPCCSRCPARRGVAAFVDEFNKATVFLCCRTGVRGDRAPSLVGLASLVVLFETNGSIDFNIENIKCNIDH